MGSMNKKETINLLDLLSESDSELSDLIPPCPRKKKVKRRRKRSNVNTKHGNSPCNCNISKTRIVTLWLAIILISWLIVLSFLAAILYDEIGRMDTSLKSAMADNTGMRVNVDKCYLLSKNVHQNQTNLFNQLHVIKAQIANFTIQLSGVQQDLHDVHELLNNIPKQTNAPNDLKSVWTNVASLGSRIADLEVTRNLLKEQWTTLQDAQNRLEQNVTDTRNTIAELSKRPESSTNETLLKTEEMQHAISQVNTSLLRINDTLSKSIKFVSDDQRKDHNLLNSLQDKTQNASVKVISLEGQCAKISDQKVINDSLIKLTSEVHNAREVNLEMMNKVHQLEKTYDALKNETDILISSVAIAKSRNENRDESSTGVYNSKSNSTSSRRDLGD